MHLVASVLGDPDSVAPDLGRPARSSESPPSERRALPMLVSGRGDRDEECANYDGCLSRFVRTAGRRSDGWAHCPAGCAHHAPRDRAAQLAQHATSRPGAMTTGGA